MDNFLWIYTYVLSFLMFYFQVESLHVKTVINAVANTNFTNNIITNVTPVEKLWDSTFMSCGKACLEFGDCLSYFYNSNTRLCTLFDQDFTDPLQGVTEDGWNYYTAVKDCKINGKECPIDDGYIFNGKVCMCYKYFQLKSEFAEADLYCKENEDGQLVKIDRMLKQIEIESFLAAVPDPVQNGNVFIQGRRVNGTSKWVFDNGEEMRFFQWNTKYLQPQLGEGENVIAIQTALGKLWSDTTETQSMMFICEKVL